MLQFFTSGDLMALNSPLCEGLPAGLELNLEQIRKKCNVVIGTGAGSSTHEEDTVEIVSGVRQGRL